jgi:TrmH family RNA methyltransferase
VAVLRVSDRERLKVVLVRTRNPLNIGSVARVMSNFGFSELRLVNPYEPSFREARSAVGAEELLRRAKVFPSVAEAVGDCSMVIGTSAIRTRAVDVPVKTLEAGASQIRRRLRSQETAIVFGSEKTGLSTEDLSHCNLLVKIPTSEEHLSLNLAQAVALTLYEISRGTKAVAATSVSTKASAAELERITGVLLTALQASGYTKPNSEEATEQKVRRLVRRLQLDTEDAGNLLTMLRKIIWKLEH